MCEENPREVDDEQIVLCSEFGFYCKCPGKQGSGTIR